MFAELQARWWCQLFLVTLGTVVMAPGCGEARRSTDEAFVLRASHPSPDDRLVFLVYQYDIGALGFSRLWWAVTPADYAGINLVPFELPDGYQAVGWTPTGELQVRPWTPYYDKERTRTLRSGDEFGGVRIDLLPALEEGKPPGWALPGSARS